MWVKAQNGKLYNMSTFSRFDTEVQYGITYKLVGIDDRGKRVVLLRYTSLCERNFIRDARRRIEQGIVKNWRLIDLSNICKTDYTEEEINLSPSFSKNL